MTNVIFVSMSFTTLINGKSVIKNGFFSEISNSDIKSLFIMSNLSTIIFNKITLEKCYFGLNILLFQNKIFFRLFAEFKWRKTCIEQYNFEND